MDGELVCGLHAAQATMPRSLTAYEWKDLHTIVVVDRWNMCESRNHVSFKMKTIPFCAGCGR